MNECDTVNAWPSDGASEAQISADSSTSDSEVSQPAAPALRSRAEARRVCLDVCAIRGLGARTVNRNQAGETELNIVISPRKFWNHVLRPKLAGACIDKLWKEEKTKIVLSVTDHKTGNNLNGHDDVPPEFRRLVKEDERQWEEREQGEREKISGHFDMPREDEVVAYSTYQRSRVRTKEQKEHYTSAQELTLAHCFDLDMLASNQEKMFRF
ncbi:hypothetical protein FHETE_10112 [Fusarium heterosporum]|uniref:Uncharacterized protein n=1 Tax=Fusarium heterosporum TaxID=42747 RepID=A0A8H5WH85_FUSHE|nr:hypothetical protein FHETE_10112 [Fusarium heterosporum]